MTNATASVSADIGSGAPAGNGRTLRVAQLYPRYIVGQRNSDINYYKALAAMGGQAPEITWTRYDTPAASALANAHYAWSSGVLRYRALRGVGLSKPLRVARRLVPVSNRVLEREEIDVLYTLMLFPVNRVRVPIVFDWDFCECGLPAYHEEVRKLLHVPEWIAERASVVRVSHPVSAAAFEKMFPKHRDKLMCVPQYLPGLTAISADEAERKFRELETGTCRILFVGNQARTKGLPELIEAYQALKPRFPGLELTVVSWFQDGPVAMPPGVVVRSNLPSREVFEEMRRSHIFVMPTKRDSHGRVFWEAMANGCALVAPHHSPHKELFGRFGVACDPCDPQDIAGAIETLASDPSTCRARALAARSEFEKIHDPRVVARGYVDVLRAAQRRGPAV